MYWLGKVLAKSEKPWEVDSYWREVALKKRAFSKISLEEIISTLDSFSLLWTEDGEYFKHALTQLSSESNLSPEEIRSTLKILPNLLKRENIERRVDAEFQPRELLDRFSKPRHFIGRVRAVPLGVVLHVTAGNVFLSSIDSLIMGLVTKNISLVKVSSQNTFFPLFFAVKLLEHDKAKIVADKFSILHWKGGDDKVESLLKKKVDGIMAWGGEEMMESYRIHLPKEVKLLDFGPKISLQVISAKALQNKDLNKVAQAVVRDVIPWNQGACSSPQNLYLQNGIDQDSFLKALKLAFQTANPRGAISQDESVEVLKEYYRGLYSELMEEGEIIRGEDFLIHRETNSFLRPSPLNRSLIIKPFENEEDLFQSLSPFEYYLQSCSYLLHEEEKDAYLEALASAGIKRFSPLGTITWGMEGAPHDGRQVLRELTKFIGDESRLQNYGEANESFSDSSDIKKSFQETTHPPGFIISSGGTTGEPKFVHFSYQEFDYITDMLAHNFKCQGLRSGMTVANLFVAGNLWSSFMAVEKALEKVGAIQLPIGGLCSSENILMYLAKFKPHVVMGIPSLLIMNAEYSHEKGVKLEVPMVFYAGEAMSEARMEFLKSTWGTKYFGSAGYASVDAGMIAYQCSFSKPGEHHLFKDLVEMDIIDEEAIITSLYRTTMPIKNYRTGDRVKWIDECKCGSTDPRFLLLGRVDSTLHIWSCRILVEDIERSIRETSSAIKTFQVIISDDLRDHKAREKMQLILEGPLDIDREALMLNIYNNSRDLKDTLSLDKFQASFSIMPVENGMIKRNSRTGKISQVLDLRK